MNLSFVDTFGRFGAKPTSRLRALSAMTADGALVYELLEEFDNSSDLARSRDFSGALSNTHFDR